MITAAAPPAAAVMAPVLPRKVTSFSDDIMEYFEVLEVSGAPHVIGVLGLILCYAQLPLHRLHEPLELECAALLRNGGRHFIHHRRDGGRRSSR